MHATLPATWRLPALDARSLWRLISGVAIVGLAILWWKLQLSGYRGDAYGYWLSANSGHLYDRPWNTLYASPYSPAFHQLLMPLAGLGWPAFYAAWTGIAIAAGTWLVGPVAMLGLMALKTPVAADIASGNIHVLLAAAIVLMLRYPGAASALLLTKITPGVALLWFIARGEWRRLALAAATTLGIVAVSFALAPGAWIDWARFLMTTGDAPQLAQVVTLPLWLRLGTASVLIVVAARRSWRWMLPFALVFALPSIWFAGLSLLLAVPRLARRSLSAEGVGLGSGQRAAVPDRLDTVRVEHGLG